MIMPVTGQSSPADFTIVIPTYNERARIDVLLERMFEACNAQGLAVAVVIVDDNSPDGTGAAADAWTRNHRVQVIHRSGKLGLGSAVLEGFAIAQTEIIGIMDADLSHPPELLPRLFKTMAAGQFDLVVGSRYVRGGGTTNFSFGRWLLSRVACWLARPLTPLRDPMSGFFLIRRDRLDGFRTAVKGFKIGLELSVRSQPRRLAEVGYLFVGREAGESKMTVREGVAFLRQLLGLYRSSISAPGSRNASVTVAEVVEPAVSVS
jgi:dolichol-phosphate mannosyltransferase